MNKYVFEQKIKTLSHLGVGLNDNQKQFPEMIIENYVFTHWDFNFADGWLGDAWLVRKEIEAGSCVEALRIFRSSLDKIVQKVGFISQCYMDFYSESFLFYKINDNSDKIFFYKYIKEKKGVGLQFNEEELNNYWKLQNFKFPEAFRFLQECRNSTGYMPRLMLLFSALESMCNKKEIEKEDSSTYITYDKDEMKKILGCGLFNEVFGQNGIRHKLNHGEMIDSVFERDYVDEIYKSILCYFNQEQKTNIDIGVVMPQRHFNDNKGYINCWLKPEDDFEINLKNCINSLKKENDLINGCRHILNQDPNQY